MEAKGAAPRQQVNHAFRLCLGRKPEPEEQERLLKLLDELTLLAAKNTYEALKLAGPTRQAAPTPQAAAWVGVARTLLNLDEFVTRE